jgi:thiamine transport system permease protein
MLSPFIILSALLLGVVPLLHLAFTQDAAFAFDTYIWRVLWFTLKQAFFSSLLATTFGLMLARALARTDFYGKALFINLLALPQAMPAIVVVLAITSIFGANGVLGGWFNIYGLSGILLAHVFFNMPLAARLFGASLQNIPYENFRLAEQLSFSKFDLFVHVEWPVLRRDLPRVFGLIFLICAASFVTVLTLGGPSATTLEVAIYQSLRQDFDVPRALTLSTLQIVVCAALVIMAGKLALQHTPTNSYRANYSRIANQSHWLDYPLIIIALAIMVPPLMALIVGGTAHLNFNIQAIVTSLALGSATTIICLALAWPLARTESIPNQVTTLAALIVPPAVIATGWFLALRRFDSIALVLGSIIALNALIALPFAVATLAPAFAKITKQHDQLCTQLNIVGWQRLLIIDLPLMRKPLAQAALITFVLALGDLTAVTLLGTQGIITLTSLIHGQMGHYRGNDASGTAVILATMCFTLTYIAQKIGTPND